MLLAATMTGADPPAAAAAGLLGDAARVPLLPLAAVAAPCSGCPLLDSLTGCVRPTSYGLLRGLGPGESVAGFRWRTIRLAGATGSATAPSRPAAKFNQYFIIEKTVIRCYQQHNRMMWCSCTADVTAPHLFHFPRLQLSHRRWSALNACRMQNKRHCSYRTRRCGRAVAAAGLLERCHCLALIQRWLAAKSLRRFCC